jgi:UDP-galactopyranose mutase
LDISQYKYIVVGAGFFGSTIAERVANDLKEKVLVIEKRDHIGGNSYSYTDSDSGIEVHKYGSHIFHTKNEKVWSYIKKFAEFNNYRHRVLSRINGKVYQFPINLDTINRVFSDDIHVSPQILENVLNKDRLGSVVQNPKNLEEKAINLIGPTLYKMFVEGYTKKQWGTSPKNLPASIINRIPVRHNYNQDYFDCPHQGIPIDGYGKIFQKMLKSKRITIKTGFDWKSIKSKLRNNQIVIFTGPIDEFFNYKHGALNWRSLKFEQMTMDVSDYQGTSVINYPSLENEHTRVHEFKHYNPERLESFVSEKTILFKEYPNDWRPGIDPYYPVRMTGDMLLLKKYQFEADKIPNVIFGGRLGTYKYLDMDATIALALSEYENKIKYR